MSGEDLENEPLDEEAELVASAKGLLLPMECSACGEYFVGYMEDSFCPACREGNSMLEQLLANTEPGSAEEEEAFYAYRRIEHTSRDGWLTTIIESNVNSPAPTWQQEMHDIMDQHGMYRMIDGEKVYTYPVDKGTYMVFLTVMASATMSPFHQMCVIVRFWKPEYKVTRIFVCDGGKYKFIDHAGPWKKIITIGKEDVEVLFPPFNPINFMYLQPKNKGFRELIDVWRNVKEGGVDALIRQATDVAFAK